MLEEDVYDRMCYLTTELIDPVEFKFKVLELDRVYFVDFITCKETYDVVLGTWQYLIAFHGEAGLLYFLEFKLDNKDYFDDMLRYIITNVLHPRRIMFKVYT